MGGMLSFVCGSFSQEHRPVNTVSVSKDRDVDIEREQFKIGFSVFEI